MASLAPRLYVQYVPQPPAALALQTLQARCRQAGISGNWVATDQLHLTVLHYGDSVAVFSRLKQALPGLSEAAYQAGLQNLAAELQPLLPATARVSPADLRLFGRNLVLTCDVAELRAVQAVTVQRLAAFLAACGLARADDWLASDVNFRYAVRFRPHINLCRAAASQPFVSVDLPPLELRLDQLHRP